jgi:probable rRNA maturation factor
MEIIFSDERKPGESILQKMYQAAELCLAKKDLDPERVTVSVTFVSSEEMKELNALYRNVDRVTDVLSFPQYENPEEIPEQGNILLGDVVICTEQALLQADDFFPDFVIDSFAVLIVLSAGFRRNGKSGGHRHA